MNSTILTSSVVNTPVSTSVLNILVLNSSINTSILDSISTPIGIPSVGTIKNFIASPAIFTIVSIPDSKALSTRIVEWKVQSSAQFLSREKEIEDDIDLDEET